VLEPASVNGIARREERGAAAAKAKGGPVLVRHRDRGRGQNTYIYTHR
jgi:hypothetical protein